MKPIPGMGGVLGVYAVKDLGTAGDIVPLDWADRYCMVSFGDVGRVELLLDYNVAS